MHVATGDSALVLRRVADYAADLGLVVERPADVRFDALPLRRQPLLLQVPHGHRLCRAARVDLASVAGETFVVRDSGSTTQRVFDACLAQRGLAIGVGLRVGSREAVREAVIEGLGLGVVYDAGVAGPGARRSGGCCPGAARPAPS